MKEIKPTDMLKEIVRLSGDQVEIDEPTCVLWKADHERCAGCPSDLGCGKVIRLGILMLSSSGYTPNSYDDYARMMDRISSLQDQILEAKTREELGKVPMH